jgi:GAF domain-containing protein
MLANATRLCEAHFGILHQFDGATFHIQAAQGLTPAYADLLQRTPQTPDRRNTLGRLLETREPIHVADLTLERAYLVVAVVGMGGARTLLAVPMLKETEVVGSIVIFRKEVRPFSDKQIELVKNFAALAVIAIENTRLLNELRSRTDELARSVGELQALGQVSQAVNSTLDLETVLSTIVAKAVRSPARRLARSMCSILRNANFICGPPTAWIGS